MHAFRLFIGEFKNVFVYRFRRSDLFFYSIKARGQHHCKGKVWVCRGIGGTELATGACDIAFCKARDADEGAAVGLAPGYVDGGFVSGDEPFVGVGDGVCDGRYFVHVF